MKRRRVLMKKPFDGIDDGCVLQGSASTEFDAVDFSRFQQTRARHRHAHFADRAGLGADAQADLSHAVRTHVDELARLQHHPIRLAVARVVERRDDAP